ncbi:hypothetical protein RBB50_005178 [Rhinocladiella similis]
MNGMDDNEDETDLYDDDFDSLSESALQELEQHAIRSTQAQQNAHNATTKQTHVPPKLTSLPQAHFQAQAHINARPPPHLSSSRQRDSTEFQYEDDSLELIGEEGVPTPAEEYEGYHVNQVRPSEASQREQWRQHMYGQAYSGDAHRPVNKHLQRSDGQSQYNSTGVRLDRSHRSPDRMLLDNSQQHEMTSIREQGRDAFRARMDDMIKERDVLVNDLRRTQDTVTMQKGEISIIRANFDKEKKILDRQIDALKKSMEDESAKHNAAISAMLEKNNNLTTRYQFLQQEHHQEVQEARTLKQRLKEKPATDKDAGGAATPIRGMASSLRDGFDDDDVMMLSPSKSARRSKPTTPTAANKRKRKVDVPSPVKPLVLRPTAAGPPSMPPPVAPEPALPEGRLIPIIRKDKQSARHLQFLQSVLEYRVKGTKEPLFEAMVNFSLSSSSSETFATILLEGAAQLKGARIPSDMLQLFVDLWSKSIKAEYYKPIPLLIEVVGHIMDVDLGAIDSGIVNSLVPLLQSTVAINAEKRVKHSPVNHSTFGKFRQTPQSVLNHHVDGTACLEIILSMAYIISDEADLISLFWRLIHPKFVLMMLNAWQPVSDITLMLRLLKTSIFSDTFGSIRVDDQQKQTEQHIMNRICCLLWETPKVDEGLPANTTTSICQLRLQVMDLLLQVTTIPSTYSQEDQTHHGSLLVAGHPSAIARIVRSLYDEVSAMYDLTPSHALHAAIVNKGVQLLFHVLETHGSQINLQEKLSVINGGVHKHRVVLTRLAFSEGFYVDRLITDDTVAMATSMLEESVTPDEADELIEAFPGFRGRGRVEEGE